MRLVRGRGEARWLPSRHTFALFRLFAFLRLRAAKPDPRAALALVVDRGPTAIEHHLVSAWVMLTVACYVAATLFASWPVPLALPVGLVVAAIVLQIPVIGFGLIVPGHRINGQVLMSLLLAAAAYLATQRTWVRFAAWQFLAVVALNALASAIVFLLREPIARLERGVVSES
jgi:hypothetical protein